MPLSSEVFLSDRHQHTPEPDRFAHSALLDALPDGVVIVDGEGRIVDFNVRAQGLFGYTRADVVGESVELLIPNRFHEQHVVDRGGYHDKPHVRPMGQQRTLVARCKDGRELPVEISLSPYQSAAGALVVATIREVPPRGHASG